MIRLVMGLLTARSWRSVVVVVVFFLLAVADVPLWLKLAVTLPFVAVAGARFLRRHGYLGGRSA